MEIVKTETVMEHNDQTDSDVEYTLNYYDNGVIEKYPTENPPQPVTESIATPILSPIQESIYKIQMNTEILIALAELTTPPLIHDILKRHPSRKVSKIQSQNFPGWDFLREVSEKSERRDAA